MLAPAGTALYGAPEQFLDQRGDERSDLYALGGVLFALLTGEPPFGDGAPAGRRTCGWNLVTDVTLEHLAEFRWGPSYAALHIRPQEKGPQNDFPSPAGMVRPRSPRGKAGRGSSRPLCVLGHMTEQQHKALIAALARYAGPRWKPGLSE